MVANILTVTALLLASASALLLVRNRRVYSYRRDLLDRINRAAHEAIRLADDAADMNQIWRYDVFASVNYDRMVWNFWKPCRSFWSDWSFIDPAANRPTVNRFTTTVD